MSNVVLFSELTTSEAIDKLVAEGEKYQGLYVDMSDKDQRKFVKDQATFIKDLLKKLDRKRIDLSKNYKASVEAEAKSIREKLEFANSPFTKLIDEWNEQRAKELAEQKRIQELKELAEQKERDHEEALILNKLWDLESADRERKREEERQAQIKREQEIAEQAAKQALIDAENARKAEEQRIENERLNREADTTHKASVNNAILSVLIDNGIAEQDAKTMIKLAAKRQLPNLTINY
jgi:hypothetical protein